MSKRTVYKIKHPNGTFKQVFKYKDIGNGMHMVVGAIDFMCDYDAKSKILLFKGCSWVETLEEFMDETPPPDML